MTTKQYIFKVKDVEKITDGDTYWLYLDVGFRQTILVNIRLLGYDCPEVTKGTELERQKGIEAKVLAEEWLFDKSHPIWVKTERDPDNFGRWLGEVWKEESDGVKIYLGLYLMSYGLAVQWPKRWHEVYAQ